LQTEEELMGVLTDILVADESEASAIASEGVPTKRWHGIDAKGIDQVKLGTLWALLTEQAYKSELIADFISLHEVSEEGPWVYRVPGSLVKLLAELDDKRAAKTSLTWAATEEFELDGWEGSQVRSFLDQLRSIARDATAKRKGLLMWMSL
jgi:hypothetical protein